MKLPCYMCEKRPARRLTARRDGQVYVNAEGVLLFCSLRCAANYALLWGAAQVHEAFHFCKASKSWECVAQDECDECNRAPLS